MSWVIQQGKVTSNTMYHVASKQLLYPVKNGQSLVILDWVIFLGAGMHFWNATLSYVMDSQR